MTSEMQQLANDPNFVVQFAVGDPIPNLVPQSKDSGIKMAGVYFDTTKRYVMKSCHMSREDVSRSLLDIADPLHIILLILKCIYLFVSQVRILDVATGQVILVSHHPGKNPYEKFDPLGLGNSGKQHAVMGGEWESATDVSSRHPSMPCFKIRPKPMSAHGRQYIKNMHGELVWQ